MLMKQTYNACDNQIDRHNKVQESWKDQDEYPGDEGENWLMHRHDRRHYALLP
jgi:hypothetical protein